jgi:hypothetical protein
VRRVLFPSPSYPHACPPAPEIILFPELIPIFRKSGQPQALHSNPGSGSLNMLEAEILSLETSLLQRIKSPEWEWKGTLLRAKEVWVWT